MKRLILALGVVLAAATGTFAQQAKPKAAKTAKSTAAAATPAATPTSTPAATSKSGGPTKKDGTPDMRYKANKQAGTTSTPATTHLKKDGTPDKRFKENKTK